MRTKSLKAVEMIERKCIKGELGGAEFTRECFLGTRLRSFVEMEKAWSIQEDMTVGVKLSTGNSRLTLFGWHHEHFRLAENKVNFILNEMSALLIF